MEQEDQYFLEDSNEETKKRNDVGLDDQGLWLRNSANRLFIYIGIVQEIDEGVFEALKRIISGSLGPSRWSCYCHCCLDERQYSRCPGGIMSLGRHSNQELLQSSQLRDGERRGKT